MMKMYAKVLGCLFTIGVLMLSSFPVFAGSGDGVVYEADGTASDYVGITIDGSYDDWADKPHSKISQGWGQENKYHLAALFRDEDYVYLHISIYPDDFAQFNGNDYLFTVDGVENYVLAVPPDGTSITDGNTPLVIRNQNGYGIITGAAGVVTRSSSYPDEWELKIPLSFFSTSPQTIKSISFYCSNLGKQTLVAVGTPTLPFVVAGSGLVIAGISYFLVKRKHKA